VQAAQNLSFLRIDGWGKEKFQAREGPAAGHAFETSLESGSFWKRRKTAKGYSNSRR
jgi:hypothetical protein